MRALAILQRDAAPGLTDVPEVEPGAGEVVVRVEAASVNGFDLAVAAGRVWDHMKHEFPVVLGRDFAGTVERLGEGADLALGDRVVGVIQTGGLGRGAIAERVTAAAATLARVPAGVPATEAAGLALAGATAVGLLDALEVGTADVVLISGATGGVGALAVQLAAARGAHVIATARPAAQDAVRALGAADVVDHTADLAAQVRAIAPAGVAKIGHAAGDPAALAALLSEGGRFATLRGDDPAVVGRTDVEFVPVRGTASVAKLDALLAEVASGRLTVPVAATYPLDRAGDALAAFEAGGKLGKIVVEI
jgi:NADPH:quinone reductase-like Zn-dependent oxidoreductase